MIVDRQRDKIGPQVQSFCHITQSSDLNGVQCIIIDNFGLWKHCQQWEYTFFDSKFPHGKSFSVCIYIYTKNVMRNQHSRNLGVFVTSNILGTSQSHDTQSRLVDNKDVDTFAACNSNGKNSSCIH